MQTEWNSSEIGKSISPSHSIYHMILIKNNTVLVVSLIKWINNRTNDWGEKSVISWIDSIILFSSYGNVDKQEEGE